MKRLIYLFSFSFLLILCMAHEYWIAPSKYQVRSGESFRFNCYAGEDFKEAIWAKRKTRTGKVSHYFTGKAEDITATFIEKDSVDINLSLKEPGNHLITMQTKPSYIEMEADAFNDYLKEDGMQNMLDYRINNHQEKKRSREFYQRCAKTLLQVDGKNDETYKTNTGMALEIIPQSNPYMIPNGELIVFFSYKGKPLSNYQVRTWCKQNGKLIVKAFHVTDEKGFAKLPIKESGEWMISLVKMELFTDVEKADYDSYWGSYTFYKN